ncbi:hypothetical protein P154DRAFT_579250 [Amniculicola lignicola CBS 123094]|uniref:Uncharacterized protein n=1 Tax=Amniculicola lignicola CBS 123094 TaxID=1392246 RepID=A0A6A5W5I9_9PLEO|nr:hypothetical protein P154DRAFT_579250 [Amniculicola lignicola CBS 123094]
MAATTGPKTATAKQNPNRFPGIYAEEVSKFPPPMTSLGDLDNEVHPLFAKNRVIDDITSKVVTDEAYQRLTPALSCHTADAQSITEAAIGFMAENTYIHLGDHSLPAGEAGPCAVCNFHPKRTKGRIDELEIQVKQEQGSGFRDHLDEFENYTLAGQANRLFQFVQSAGHEPAHALWRFVHGAESEPCCYKGHAIAENGYSWEKTTLGSHLWSYHERLELRYDQYKTFELFLDGQMIDQAVIKSFSNAFLDSRREVAESVWDACKEPACYEIPQDFRWDERRLANMWYASHESRFEVTPESWSKKAPAASAEEIPPWWTPLSYLLLMWLILYLKPLEISGGPIG